MNENNNEGCEGGGDEFPDDADLFGFLLGKVSGHKRSYARQRAFLIVFSESGLIGRTCKAVGISPRTQLRWRKNDPAFAAAFDVAKDMACDLALDAAIDRAIAGIERVKFDRRGNVFRDPKTGSVYAERRPSDLLTIFLLKHLQPDTFGDKAGQGKRVREIVVKFVDEYSSHPAYRENTATA